MIQKKTPQRTFLSSPRNKHRFHVMIKPIGALCNLECTYCYYLHKSELLQYAQEKELNTSCTTQHVAKMDDATLELFIKQYLEANENEKVVFSWQGGEPTLLGLPFFEKAVRLQKKYAQNDRIIANTLQTNGTLLTDAWAAFLKEHDFLVGLSVDGPEHIHNMHRYDKAGKGSFTRLMQGYESLRKHQVSFTTLTTVNSHNAQKPLEVYNFLTKELGSTYVQFNPCVEPKTFTNIAPHYWEKDSLPTMSASQEFSEDIEAFVTEWSVRPQQWGTFLCTVFDAWVNNDLGKVLVNWFETAVAQTMKLPAQLCTTGHLCGKGVALEHDGSVYSCDHYVNPEYYLGNIHKDTLKNIVFCARQQEFAFKKQKMLAQECLQCSYGTLCWGQCPRHRFVRTRANDHALNYLCPGFKTFYNHAMPAVRAIAQACAQC